MAVNVSQNIQSLCRIVLYAVNAFFIILALIVMGVGLYLLLYKAELLAVAFEMPHISASVYIIILCGGAILVLAIFGLVANCIGNIYILAAYCILLLLVAILSITAGVIGIIFKSTWYIDEVRQAMKDRIQQNYGIDVNTSDYNAQITDIWDTMQQWWYCCGVEDNSWGIYRQSEWYNRQPGDPGVKEFTAEMVPVSCCRKSQYGKYVDIQKCQNWQLGPPNLQTGPDPNEALHYVGCFTIGSDMLELVSGGVIGLGLVVGVVLFAGIVPAALLVLALRSGRPSLPPQAPSSRAYYTPSVGKVLTNSGPYDNQFAGGGYDNPSVTTSASY